MRTKRVTAPTTIKFAHDGKKGTFNTETWQVTYGGITFQASACQLGLKKAIDRAIANHLRQHYLSSVRVPARLKKRQSIAP